MNEAGLFDWQERFEQLNEGGDPLVKLNDLMDWNMFAKRLKTLRDKERKSNAGRKPFDAPLMFKILILQSLYNLSDDQMEFQIRDRLSFMRFLGLSLHDRIPDAKTIFFIKSFSFGFNPLFTTHRIFITCAKGTLIIQDPSA